MSFQFRQLVKDLSPPWLQDGQLERYVYNFGLSLDLLAEKLVQGMHMRIPTLCDPSALPVLGADALIPQGASESDDVYRTRLQGSDQAWQDAGTPWAILRQALHTLLPLRPAARLVADRYTLTAYPATIDLSKWDSYAAGGDADTAQPTHQVVTPGNWDWDSLNVCRTSWAWSRFWCVVESVAPNDWCHEDTTLWDSSTDTWDTSPTQAWDLDVDASVCDAIWSELLLWKPLNAPCEALIISFDATHFAEGHAAGGGINPDGEFGRWSKMSGTSQVAARTITGAVFGHRIQ